MYNREDLGFRGEFREEVNKVSRSINMHFTRKPTLNIHKTVENTNKNSQNMLQNVYNVGFKKTSVWTASFQTQGNVSALPFQAVQHVVTTCDVQPIPGGQGGNIIMVMGQLKVGKFF